MNVHRLEQLAMHCRDVQGIAALMNDALGIPFGATRYAGVAGDRLEIRASPLGVVLVGAGEDRPEGLRAVGFRVDGLEEIERRLEARGLRPALEIDAPGYLERQYDISSVRLSLAEYSGPDRLTAAERAGILEARQ